MATELYNVIFQGQIAAGQSQEQVKQTLAQVFKRPPQELERLFTGQPLVILKQADEQAALCYKNIFERAGALCTVVSVEPPRAAGTETAASENSDQRYQLVFRGEILPGKQIDVVKNILAAKFKLTPQQVALYFSGQPCQLTKAPVDYAIALKYQSAFEKAGALCHLEPAKSDRPKPAAKLAPPQPQCATPQQPQPPATMPPDMPAAMPTSQPAQASGQPMTHKEPPPLPDVLPPMPKMPSPLRQTPPSVQKPKKKNSNLWILAIVLPFAFFFLFGIVAAIAVPNLLTAIQRSKVARTKADMHAIGTALGSFQVDSNAFPVTEDWEYFSEDTLPKEYYGGVYRDAWQNWFFYQSDGKTYQLVSYGKDMREGGEDFDADIVLTNGTFGE